MADTKQASMTNTDLVRGAHEPLMTAVKGEKGCTLTGVSLVMEGGKPTIRTARDENGNGVAVKHTKAEVKTWANAMVNRLIAERKSYEPTGGTEGGWGAAVLAENLSITLVKNGNPCWQGIVGSDLREQRIAASKARAAARVAETGGFRIHMDTVDSGDFIDASDMSAEDRKSLEGSVFPSPRKAAARLNRLVYGENWHATEKSDRKKMGRMCVVNAASGEFVVERKDTDATTPEPVAEAAPVATIATLRAQAKALGLKANGSKADLSERIQTRLQELGLI